MMRSEGEMPIMEDFPVTGNNVRQVLQEEGEGQLKRARGSLDPRIQDDLERAMEREVFMQLQEESNQSRRELEQARQKKAEEVRSSEWSEVSVEHPDTRSSRWTTTS